MYVMAGLKIQSTEEKEEEQMNSKTNSNYENLYLKNKNRDQDKKTTKTKPRQRYSIYNTCIFIRAISVATAIPSLMTHPVHSL